MKIVKREIWGYEAFDLTDFEIVHYWDPLWMLSDTKCGKWVRKRLGIDFVAKRVVRNYIQAHEK